MELITKSFANQCMAFPDRVDRMLVEVTTVSEAKGMLDQAASELAEVALFGAAATRCDRNRVARILTARGPHDRRLDVARVGADGQSEPVAILGAFDR